MTIEINGVSLEFNMLDADFVDDYEAALKDVQEYKTPEGATTGETIRGVCDCVNTFFDRVFGNGTAEAIFGDKHDLNVTTDALQIVVEAAEQQSKDYNDKLSAIRGGKVTRFKVKS